ncbi:hypothetical protein 4Roscha1_00083 [Erwinia phage Roscha1]|nr:hypothetical protein 4Roscha1_00083 [Erwinia phage Roscha1]
MVDRLRKTYLPFEVSFEKPQEKPKKVNKKELARLAKEVGEEYFYADCKKHGAGAKHSVRNSKCCCCLTDYHKEYNKKYRKENKEAISEYKRKYRKENKEARSDYFKRWYQENKESLLEYRRENKEAILEYKNKYREENRESLLEYQKNYRKENAAYIFARSALSRLDDNSQEVFSGITKDEAESLCGYSQVEFILHIESTFKEGMSWENRSEWHIDHILPVAWFKEQGITDIKVINALSNLRAEWANDNMSKGRNFLEEDLTEEEFLEIIMNEVDDGKDF